MAGYSDTRQLIIDTLMGRPAGTEIQPEDHQAFALALNDYIRSVELVAGSGVPVDFAEPDTVPVQPDNGQAVYLSYVPRSATKNFVNFINKSGNSISITSSSGEVKLVTLLWNGSYWSSQIVTISVISDDSSVNASNIGASDYILFSTSSNYSIGDIVRYDGKLYKFTAEHAAGAWIGTDVELASINSILTSKILELESNQNLSAFGDFEFPNNHSVTINKLYIFNTPNGKQILYDDESVVKTHELNLSRGFGILVLHQDGKADVVPAFVNVLPTDIVLLRYNNDVDGGISGGLLYRWYLKSLSNTIRENSNVDIGVSSPGYIRISKRENKRFLEWRTCFVGFRNYFEKQIFFLSEESYNNGDKFLSPQSIEIQSGVPFYINFSEWVDAVNKVVLHHDNNFSSDSVMLGIIGGSKVVLGLPLMELLFLSDNVNEIETTNIVKSLSHQSILPESNSYIGFDGKSVDEEIYLMSDFIPVKEGESYSYTGNVGSLGVAIAGYFSNSENAFVQVILTNGSHNQEKITIPSGVTYIRYCGRTNARLSFVPSILDMGVECGEIYYPILDDYGYLNFDGTKVSNTYYLMTDFIPVNEGEIFRYTGKCGNAGVAIVGYSASSENSYVATLVTNGEFNNHEFTIPSGVSFIRACGSNELLGFDNPSLRKLTSTSFANISEWKGKNVVILGDSISTNDNTTTIERNAPEILITTEDVGKSLSAYLTYYDVQNGLSLGGHTFTSAEIGTEVSFVPTTEDVGKAIGLPNNYNLGNVVVWWEYLKERMGINPIPVCWSGSSITSHEGNNNMYKTSYAWHPAQLRKCGIRISGTMERTAPDVIIIYRGTNDFSHSPYTKLTKDYFENIDLEIADTDVVDGGYGFKEGMCLTIKKMRELYPFAKIVLCTLNVFKRINYGHFPTNNGLNSLPQYNDAIREIADYMGCGLIEFDKDGITFENCYPTYISDSATIPTHPNNNGHYVMGMKALTDLKKL